MYICIYIFIFPVLEGMVPWQPAVKAKPFTRGRTEPTNHTTESSVVGELHALKIEYNRICIRLGVTHPDAVAFGDSLDTIEAVLKGRPRSRSRSR